MSLLNVGARALLANQVALQTTGHNIANASTAGYSRQSVDLRTEQGRLTGAGYIGNGVNVATIVRNHDALLTRQAAAAQAVQAGDSVRSERLSQLQNVFQGGTSGLGASITDMLNSLADVVASPNDITARTVTLTRMNEMASRMRGSATQLKEIADSVTQQLENHTTRINQLAQGIAEANEQISRVRGNGQPPNDLLDKRDQLIRELNQYIQTTQIAADDGTVGVFVAGSQPLVLGTTATSLSVEESQTFPGSGQMRLVFNRPGSAPVELEESMLGGGEVAGLLKFANSDLAEGSNLLGRMALAIGTAMNYQQTLGLTLDGQMGKPLFAVPASVKGLSSNTATDGGVKFNDPTKFAASDYEVRFTASGGNAAQIIRLSDGQVTQVPALANLTSPNGVTVDGLTFSFTTLGATDERVLFKPFASAAADMQSLVYSPRDLAAANPINAAMGTSNGGTLQLAGLKPTGQRWNGVTGQVDNTGSIQAPPGPTPPAVTGGGVTLTFAANGTFTVNGNTDAPLDLGVNPPAPMTPPYQYTPGKPISIDGWELTLQGAPKAGDKVTVGNAKDPQYGDWYTRNAGNASALMALRDVKMFDQSTLSDGYAGLMAQVGTRTQGAQYAAKLSDSIASNLETSRTAVSGVNLDEEAAKLIQYQQAYQASAKVLQIAQNIFDNLLQSMGR